jgi:hypothetical protein
MADRRRSSREIEREVEHERAELRGTVEELFSRFTFEDAWNRVGAYMRDNRGTLGHTFERAVREKPLAVALTAVGVGWLLFGPAQQAKGARTRSRAARPGYGAGDRARMLARLEEADFADPSARGPSAPDAQPDPWEAPSRTPAATKAPATYGPAGDASSGAPPDEPAPPPRPEPVPGAAGAAPSPPGTGGTSRP